MSLFVRGPAGFVMKAGDLRLLIVIRLQLQGGDIMNNNTVNIGTRLTQQVLAPRVHL